MKRFGNLARCPLRPLELVFARRPVQLADFDPDPNVRQCSCGFSKVAGHQEFVAKRQFGFTMTLGFENNSKHDRRRHSRLKDV